MKIMTLNTWGGRLGEDFLDFISNREEEVICLQEVFDSTEYSGYFRDIHEDKAPIHIDLFSEIQKKLPDHRGVLHPACMWKVRGKESSEDLLCPFGIATFVREDVVVHEMHTKFVYEDFRSIPRFDVPEPRVAAAMRFVDPKTGRPTVVATMHGLWIESGKHHTIERTRQALAFADLIFRTKRPGDQVVACGDFNVLPDDPTFGILRATVSLEDLVVKSGFEGTRTRHYYGNPKKKGMPLYADYMLVSPEVRMAKLDVLYEPVVSDHCPLVLEIE